MPRDSVGGSGLERPFRQKKFVNYPNPEKRKIISVAACLGLVLMFQPLRLLADAPMIFKALDPVGPDETVLLFGSGVTEETTAEGVRLDDHVVSAPPIEVMHKLKAVALPLKVLQKTDLSLKALIPATWMPGIYVVRVKNGEGASEWQFLNRPKIWWLMCGLGGKAVPGGNVRICGLNFGKKSRVWLQPDQGASRELPVRDARDNDLTVTLPKEAVPGHYRIWVHNGHGGQGGFGEPEEMTVETYTPWPDQRFDVQKFGAKGDGQTDDTKALSDALAAVQSAGGGVLWIPRGIYIITGKLVVPEHTVVRGESRDVVWLKVPSKAAPFNAVLAGNGNFGVEDLSIVSQTAQRLVACPDVPSTYARERANWGNNDPAPGGVILRRLRLQHLNFAHRLNKDDPRRLLSDGQATVTLRGPDCEVADCVIVSSGMPLQISRALRAQILRNQLGTGRNGWYGIWDFECGIFEGNEILARDLEGSFGGVQGTARCLLFRGNSWHDAYGDEREALTFDTPYHPQWVGTVKMNEPDDLELAVKSYGTWPPPPGFPSQLAAVIVGGKGLGQLVPVRSMNPTGLKLESPWKITPDENSIIAIGVNKSNVIVTDNWFSDSSAGPQLYAQSYSFVVSHNHSERTGGSYANAWNAIDNRQRQRLSYAFFNQWLENEYLHGFSYDQGPYPIGFLGYSVGREISLPPTVTAIGNRYERNILDERTMMGIRTTIKQPEGSPMISRDAVFENNSWTDLPIKISIGKNNAYSLLRNNQKGSSQAEIDDQGMQTMIVKKDAK